MEGRKVATREGNTIGSILGVHSAALLLGSDSSNLEIIFCFLGILKNVLGIPLKIFLVDLGNGQ